MSWLQEYVDHAVTVAGGGELADTSTIPVTPDVATENGIDTDTQERLAENDLFVLGGPVANTVSRHLLYGRGNNGTAQELMQETVMPWVFDLCPDPTVEDMPVKKLHTADVHPAWPLVNTETRERFLPDSFNETRRDFFLITYTENPFNPGKDAVLAAGCSQPGTTAAHTVLTRNQDLEGSGTFHDYLVNGSNQGDTFFTAVGRCHVKQGEPVKVVDIDFQQLQ